MNTVVSGGGSASLDRNRAVSVPSDTPLDDVRVLQAALAQGKGSRDQLCDLLLRPPAWIDRIGTLAVEAERALLESAKAQAIVEEVWRTDLARLRESLLRPKYGTLERMLVERVALCWAAVTLDEVKRESRWAKGIWTSDAGFWDRHVSRLHADFLRACRTLATVRRVRIPQVQVNTAEQQVNLSA